MLNKLIKIQKHGLYKSVRYNNQIPMMLVCFCDNYDINSISFFLYVDNKLCDDCFVYIINYNFHPYPNQCQNVWMEKEASSLDANVYYHLVLI